jgi:hypothetical protein
MSYTYLIDVCSPSLMMARKESKHVEDMFKILNINLH